MFQKPLSSPSSPLEASMLTATHGTTVVSTCRTMTPLHGRPAILAQTAAAAAAVATITNFLRSSIQAMPPQDIQCGPQPTAVALQLPILQPQDTPDPLAHRVLKWHFSYFLDSLCCTLAGYIPWRANTPKYQLFCFAAFEFPLLCFLVLLLYCVCFREKHEASLRNTDLEDRVIRSVRKEEIPICVDF
jgi:hypothetical protein